MLLSAASDASAGEMLLPQMCFTQAKFDYYIYKNGMVKSQEALDNLLLSISVRCINLYGAFPRTTEESLWGV